MNTAKNDDIKRMAWENYHHIQAGAERRFDTTISQARQKYERQIETAREEYDSVKREAQNTYETTVNGAKNDYDQTVAMVAGNFRRHTTRHWKKEPVGENG